MKTLTFISCTLGIGLALSACGRDPILLGELIHGEGGDDDVAAGPDEVEPQQPPSTPPTTTPEPVPSDPREARVVSILLYYCGDCHDGAREHSGGFEVIGDIDAVVDYGMIIPGDRDQSRVYQRMVDGTMPPISVDVPRPTEEEIEDIGSFIDDME